ncbi:MAG: hypothetical protein WCI64_10950 [Chlorobium sp.]
MIRQGYKQTEVGVIPEDWEVKTGEQITVLVGKGASPRLQGFEYTTAGMLFVTSENVRDGYLDMSKPKYLPMAFHEKIKRSKLQKYDVLINLVGASIGRSCQVLSDLGEAITMQRLLTGKTRLSGFSGEWEVQRLGDIGHCLRGVSYRGDSDLSTYDMTHTKRLLRSNNIMDASVIQPSA